MSLVVVFYRTESGNEPVREWLKGLSRLNKRIARILFTVRGSQMVLLHGFIKKSQKTPQDCLQLAKDRKANLEK